MATFGAIHGTRGGNKVYVLPGAGRHKAIYNAARKHGAGKAIARQELARAIKKGRGGSGWHGGKIKTLFKEVGGTKKRYGRAMGSIQRRDAKGRFA